MRVRTGPINCLEIHQSYLKFSDFLNAICREGLSFYSLLRFFRASTGFSSVVDPDTDPHGSGSEIIVPDPDPAKVKSIYIKL